MQPQLPQRALTGEREGGPVGEAALRVGSYIGLLNSARDGAQRDGGARDSWTDGDPVTLSDGGR